MITLDQIKLFCSKDTLRPVLCCPFRVALADAHTYTCATNGHILILVQDDDNAVGVPVLPKEVLEAIERKECKIPNVESVLVDLATCTRFTVPTAALRDFAGPDKENDPAYQCPACKGERGETCPDCNGQGGEPCQCDHCGREHDFECRRCRSKGFLTCIDCCGTGRIYKNRHHEGNLGSTVLNLDYLSRILGVVDSEAIDVYHTGDPLNAITIKYPGVTFLLMPLRTSEISSPPVFRLKPYRR